MWQIIWITFGAWIEVLFSLNLIFYVPNETIYFFRLFRALRFRSLLLEILVYHIAAAVAQLSQKSVKQAVLKPL